MLVPQAINPTKSPRTEASRPVEYYSIQAPQFRAPVNHERITPASSPAPVHSAPPSGSRPLRPAQLFIEEVTTVEETESESYSSSDTGEDIIAPKRVPTVEAPIQKVCNLASEEFWLN